MNTIDLDLVYLANKVSDNLHNPQSSDTDFDIKITRSPRKLNTNKNKSKVARPFSHPKHFADNDASSSSTKSSLIFENDSRMTNPETEFNECAQSNCSVGSVTVKSEDMEEADEMSTADSDKIKSIKSREGNQGSNVGSKTIEDNDDRFAGFKKSLVSHCNFLPLEELTADDELWLIIAPKDYKFKKQNVDMTSRQELKGGRFEMQCFNQGLSRNNLTTLVSNDNILVTGRSFKGCVQISRKLQTFRTVYHESVLKEHPIPKGLKERYIPFGTDIKLRDTDKHTENSTEKLNTVDDGVLEGMENSAKHPKIKEVILNEQYNSSPSKKKKKKKRKHEDSVLSEVDGTAEPPLNLGNTSYNSIMVDNTKHITTEDKLPSNIKEEDNSSPSKKKKKKKRKHEDSVLSEVDGTAEPPLNLGNSPYNSIINTKHITTVDKLPSNIKEEDNSSPSKKKRIQFDESVLPEMGDNSEHQEQSNNSSTKKKKKKKHSHCDE